MILKIKWSSFCDLNFKVPGGSDSKESACNAEDLDSIPGLERSPGEGNGYPLQYSGLENSTDCTAHGVAESQTRLSNFDLKGYLLFPSGKNILTANQIFES